MAKHAKHKPKTQRSVVSAPPDMLQYEAESMVRDAFMTSPAAKTEVKKVHRTLVQTRKKVQASLKKKR